MAIDDMTQHIGGDLPKYNWFVSDIGFTPASWRITVAKNGLDPLPIDVALSTRKTLLFGGTFVPLPHQFPPPLLYGFTKTGLRVPIVLPPNLAGVPPPICRWTSPARVGLNEPNAYCFPNSFPFGSMPLLRGQEQLPRSVETMAVRLIRAADCHLLPRCLCGKGLQHEVHAAGGGDARQSAGR
jgi:hypothetical protein